MPDYRCCRVPGGAYFFTLKGLKRRTDLPVRHSAALREAVVRTRAKRPCRFREHILRDKDNYVRHMDYVHFKPVKHGYVTAVAQWPYSAFHRWVKAGIYPVG